MAVEELVESCRNDDHMAVEELVKRYEKIVYTTLYHLDPNRGDIADLAQEALYRMAKSVKNIKNPKTFRFWLNQIITNLFYDELRRKTRRLNTISIDTSLMESPEEDFGASRDIVDEDKIPEEKSLAVELDKKIRDAMDSLPEQFRVVIVLRELQGLSYDEISVITNLSIGTVKSRIARARARLQQILRPYLNEERS